MCLTGAKDSTSSLTEPEVNVCVSAKLLLGFSAVENTIRMELRIDTDDADHPPLDQHVVSYVEQEHHGRVARLQLDLAFLRVCCWFWTYCYFKCYCY
jgi:hypothetical protein